MSENSDSNDNASRDEERWRDSMMASVRARQAAEARAPINESGLCADCEEPIETRRLLNNPRARRCVGCQQDQDARSRR